MMYSDVGELGETAAFIQNVHESPLSYLDDYPTVSALSPLLLPPDTQNYLQDQTETWQGLQDISHVNVESNQFLHSDISSSTTQDDYIITSLDEVTSTVNDVITYGSSNAASPESLTNSNSSTDSAEASPKSFVTSRLKSILMSRQKMQSPTSASLSRGSASSASLHNYSRFEKKRKVENVNGIQEQNRDKYSPNSALRFPPCFICGGTASGLHYGVNSCEPCKGFFTRYLRKQEEYKCAKDNKCLITNRLRGNCSACRLKRCLALGMSRKNSRLGRYSLSRRMETIMQVNELERKNAERENDQICQNFNGAQGNEIGLDCNVYPTTNSEPGNEIGQDYNVYPTTSSEPGSEIGLDYNVYPNTNSETSIEIGLDYNVYPTPNSESVSAEANENLELKRKKHFGPCNVKAPAGFSHKLVKALVEHMEYIKPYGEDLVTDEQIKSKLISHFESYKLKISLFGNLKTIPKDEYFKLRKKYGIEIDSRMMFLKQSANEMIDIIERYCNFAKQIPNFKTLSNRDQKNLLKSSRYDFFMILMHSGYLHEKQVFLAHNGAAFHMEEVADKFFSRKLVINVCDMYHRLQNLKLSREENALLIAISLVFTDRCSLENPRLVEQIQFSLTQLLQKQLEKTCPSSAFRRFTKIIDCLTTMRESSELFLKEYNELCQDEMVIEEVPIMTELLFED